MQWEIVVIIVLAVLLAAACIGLLALVNKYRKEKRRSREDAGFAEDVRVKGGVRYSADDAVERAGEANITFRKGDVMLPRGETFVAAKGEKVMPGTYTVLAVSENVRAFKLRVGGLVRSYEHGDTLVLAEGEAVCAVSCAVILR